MMTRLIEFIVEALLEIFFNFEIGNRKEEAEFHKLQSSLRKEHAIAAQYWAERGKQRSLRGFDLTGADFEDVDLAKADLSEASFRTANLTNVDLSEANLNKTDFTGAVLVKINFSRANLGSADFSQATLQNVNFNQANMRAARLSSAKEITNCIWNGVYINSQTQLNQMIKNKIFDTYQGV